MLEETRATSTSWLAVKLWTTSSLLWAEKGEASPADGRDATVPQFHLSATPKENGIVRAGLARA